MDKQFTITLSFYGNNEFYTTVIDLMPEEDDEKYPSMLEYEKAYHKWENEVKLPFAKKQFNLLGLDENRFILVDVNLHPECADEAFEYTVVEIIE